MIEEIGLMMDWAAGQLQLCANYEQTMRKPHETKPSWLPEAGADCSWVFIHFSCAYNYFMFAYV